MELILFVIIATGLISSILTINNGAYIDGDYTTGTLTADRVTSSLASTADTCYASKTVSVAADTVTRTLSCFFKFEATVDVSTLVMTCGATETVASFSWVDHGLTITGIGTGNVTDAGGGWYRVSVTMPNNSSTAIICRAYVRDRGVLNTILDQVALIGFQLEVGSVPTAHVASSATNLLPYSEQFNNAAWTKTLVTVNENNIVAPDGTLTAAKIVCTGTNDPQISQSIGIGSSVGGKTFTLSVWAWTDAGQPTELSFFIYDGTATYVYTQTIAVSDVPTRYSFTATINVLASSSTLVVRYDLKNTSPPVGAYMYLWGAQLETGLTASPYVPTLPTFTSRASIASYINSSGLIASAATNVARLNYTPSNLTLAPKLLVEAAATNLLTYSEQFNNAAWTTTATVTPNTAYAPDGTLTADTITSTTAITSTYRTLTVTASTTYTYSYYVKLGTRTGAIYGVYNNTGAAWILSNIAPTGLSTKDWTRVVATFTTPVGCVSIDIHTERCVTAPADVGTNFLWGAQLEVGAFATSYIPTTTASVTRAADVSTSAAATSNAGSLNLINWSEQLEDPSWTLNNCVTLEDSEYSPNGTNLIKIVTTDTSSADILATWHWDGESFGMHTAHPGVYYVWDKPTLSYVLLAPSPSVTVTAIADFKTITLSIALTESNWPNGAFRYDIYSNESGSSLLIGSTTTFTFISTPTTKLAHVYTVVPIWTDASFIDHAGTSGVSASISVVYTGDNNATFGSDFTTTHDVTPAAAFVPAADITQVSLGAGSVTYNATTGLLTNNMTNFGITAAVSSTDIITLSAAHEWATGQSVMYRFTSGVAISGLIDNTVHYAIVITTTTIKLATTSANATAGTAIAIGDFTAGSVHSISTLGWQNSRYMPAPVFSTLASIAANVLTTGTHYFKTGDSVQYMQIGVSAITGLVNNVIYYVIKVTATTFKLATTKANALAGTNITVGTMTGGTSYYFSPYTTAGAKVTLTIPAQTYAPVFMIGLSQAPATLHTYQDIDYAIYLMGTLTPRFTVYESGSQIGATQPYALGDTFAVMYDGLTKITYWHNNVCFLSTIIAKTTTPFVVDSSFYTDDALATGLTYEDYVALTITKAATAIGTLTAHSVDNFITQSTFDTKHIAANSVVVMDIYENGTYTFTAPPTTINTTKVYTSVMSLTTTVTPLACNRTVFIGFNFINTDTTCGGVTVTMKKAGVAIHSWAIDIGTRQVAGNNVMAVSLIDSLYTTGTAEVFTVDFTLTNGSVAGESWKAGLVPQISNQELIILTGKR